MFVRSHLLVCLYFRLRRHSTEDAYAPTFAKVDFGGKIWFDSGPLGVAGETEFLKPTKIVDAEEENNALGSKQKDDHAPKPHIVYTSVLAEGK